MTTRGKALAGLGELRKPLGESSLDLFEMLYLCYLQPEAEVVASEGLFEVVIESLQSVSNFEVAQPEVQAPSS